MHAHKHTHTQKKAVSLSKRLLFSITRTGNDNALDRITNDLLGKKENQANKMMEEMISIISDI